MREEIETFILIQAQKLKASEVESVIRTYLLVPELNFFLFHSW